jgi:signal transduction histidine kinase
VFYRWLGEPGAGLLVALVVLLVAVNVVGFWGIIYSGREARQEVLKDLELQALAGAKSLEAILASTRADFMFLAQSPPIASLQEALGTPDPMARRWRRLDSEATLLLFLSSHPEVERITLFLDDKPVLAAGVREGAPVLLPASEQLLDANDEGDPYILGRWPLGDVDSGNRMEASLSIPELLRLASPSQKYSLALRPLSEVENVVSQDDPSSSTVVVPVRDPDWSPPIDWAILWSEKRAGLVESVTRLTARYRMTLAVNVALLFLAAVLGVIAVRQVRRGISLQLENRQQAQIRELERQLMHSERLASVGRLAAGMAHEINNPLEGMANYLTLLEEDLQSSRYDSCLEFVGKVREGLKRAASVTRRALSFADPGQKPKSLISIQNVMGDTLDFVRGTQLFRDVKVEIRELDQEVLVRGNPVTLGQAFLNLLINAAELQDGKGQVEIDFSRRDGSVVVTIADRGPGIPDGMIGKVFEPFVSGRGSSGLGLSICQTIVTSHDGRIEAANRPGGGAVFTVIMPAHDVSEAQTASSTEPRKLETELT